MGRRAGVLSGLAILAGCGRIAFDPITDPTGDGGDPGPPGTPLTTIDPMTTGSLSISLSAPGMRTAAEPAAEVVGGIRMVDLGYSSAGAFPTTLSLNPAGRALDFNQGAPDAWFTLRYPGSGGLDVALTALQSIRVEVATDSTICPCTVKAVLVDSSGRTASVARPVPAGGNSANYDLPAIEARNAGVDIERIAEIHILVDPGTAGDDMSFGPITVVP